MNRPKVVSAHDWQVARDALLVKEKQHTRALDALVAERRRMPMVRLGSDFNDDLGLGGGFGLSVLLRDGDEVFRTYFTTARGVDRLRLDFNLLDLTPYGRQEQWEDSPDGWPQDPTMAWLKPKDGYDV